MCTGGAVGEGTGEDPVGLMVAPLVNVARAAHGLPELKSL
jgi:hypothetical protein